MGRIKKNSHASSNESNFVRQGFRNVLGHSVESNSSFFHLPGSFTTTLEISHSSHFIVSMSKARILQPELKSRLGETEQHLIIGCQNAPCHQASPEPGSHLSPRLNDLSLSLVTENVSLSQSWDHSHLSIATEPAQQTPPYIKYLLGLGPKGF